jgi:hypothetical protein
MERRLGAEDNIVGNAASLPALAMVIADPTLRQIQTLIQKRETAPAGVRQKNSFLTVGDFSQMTAVLTRHADRIRALFGKAASVDDDHAVTFTQPAADEDC